MSNNLNTSAVKIPVFKKSESFIIPVASETLNGQGIYFAGDVKKLKANGGVFKVYDFFELCKDETPQKALLFLALGKEIDINSIWKKYSKSSRLFLFVCHI